jgi:hypothetical protein
MEEPPRIENVTSSRGASLSDAGSILDSFINTLDSQGQGASQPIDAKPSTPAKAAAGTSSTAAVTPRKTRAELEEESILKQFDLLSKQNTGLVSDDTYERLKLIRDSIVGEVEGRVLKPSLLKKKEAVESNGVDEFDEHRYNAYNEDDQEVDESQQFINELEEVEQELVAREEESRRSAKKAKKEKKSAKKAKKEAKKKRKQDSLRESEAGGVSEKRIKLEDDS